MNRQMIATTIAIAMLSGPAIAQTIPAQEADDHQLASSEAQHQMHQHMANMKATMERIYTEEDMAVRKQLMHEHMQEMHAMMNAVFDTQADGTMGGHMMADHAQGEGMQHEGAMPSCKEHMAQKMAMMQMMMQQMMDDDVAQEEMDSHGHE